MTSEHIDPCLSMSSANRICRGGFSVLESGQPDLLKIRSTLFLGPRISNRDQKRIKRKKTCTVGCQQKRQTKSRAARHKAQYGKSLDAEFGQATFVPIRVYCGSDQRNIIAVNNKGEDMVNYCGVTQRSSHCGRRGRSRRICFSQFAHLRFEHRFSDSRCIPCPWTAVAVTRIWSHTMFHFSPDFTLIFILVACY